MLVLNRCIKNEIECYSSEAEMISDDSDLDLEPGEIPSNKSRRYSLPPAPPILPGVTRIPPRIVGRGRGVVHTNTPHRRVPVAVLPNTVINPDEYGSSDSDQVMDSDSD